MTGIVHSTLAADFVGEYVTERWGTGEGKACWLWAHSVSDVFYLGDRDLVIRCQRSGWRTDEDVEFELNCLHELAARGLPVARPVRTADGRWFENVVVPEGHRRLSVFEYADGVPGRLPLRPGLASLLGAAAARIHATKPPCLAVAPTSRRFEPELMLDEAIGWITRLPTADMSICAWLRDLARDVVRRCAEEDPGPSVLIHGDLGPGNLHVDEGGNLTLFDFDLCGLGPASYDIAVVKWWCTVNRTGERFWREFCVGYQSENGFNAAVLDTFVALRHIWTVGLRARCAMTGDGIERSDVADLRSSLKLLSEYRIASAGG